MSSGTLHPLANPVQISGHNLQPEWPARATPRARFSTPPKMLFRHATFGLLVIAAATASTSGAELDHTFTLQAQPLLEHYCVKCHNPDKKKGELDLTAYKDTNSVQQD